MAITQVAVQSPANEFIFTDTVIGNTVDAIKASSALVYSLQINNTGNATPVYVKLYNLAAGSVVVGTTAPDEVIYVPGSAIITHVFATGGVPGKTFGTALSAICVTTGGTAGSSAPSSSVSLSVSYV